MLVLDVFLRHERFTGKNVRVPVNICKIEVVELKELDTCPFEPLNFGFVPLLKFKMFLLKFFSVVEELRINHLAYLCCPRAKSFRESLKISFSVLFHDLFSKSLNWDTNGCDCFI